MIIDIFGYIGAVLLTLLFVPQVYTTYKTKNIEGLSYIFLILEFFAALNFIIYGFLINSIPIIIANSSAFICSILLLLAKIRFKVNNEDTDVNIEIGE